MHHQDFPIQPTPPDPLRTEFGIPAPLPASVAFLDDAEFIAMLNARVEMMMVQSLSGCPISVKQVSKEEGAKILAFYALRKHSIEIADPERFCGKHDMKGAPVWEALDPLFKDESALVASIALVKQVEKLIGEKPHVDPLLFTDQKLLNKEEFALGILKADGFNWIYLSPELKRQTKFALFAIEHSKSVFQYIVQDGRGPEITADLVLAAISKNGYLLPWVPEHLFTDDLVTIAVNNGGGPKLAFAERYLGPKVWDNYERTLKAIEQSRALSKFVPEKYLADRRFREILLSAVRDEVMEVAGMPESIQCDPEFVQVIVELLPKRPNLYGWLCDKAKEIPEIKARHQSLGSKGAK